jgi:CRISPR-associated exonuclease Cas4
MKIEYEQINGTMVQYYRVCVKKLWYFVHNIQMEQNSELVSIGKELHNKTYSRTRLQEVELDGVVKFDRIEKDFICEIKKSKAIEESHLLQMKFYLWYLKKKGITGLKGKLLYPLLKQTEIVELTENDEAELEEIAKQITLLIAQEKPPQVKRMKICKSCSYEELCWS